MKIRRLMLSEVGPFDRLDLSLPAGDETDGKAEVHLLVGPNGTGKSSVLAAMAQCFSLEEVGLLGRLRSPRGHAMLQTDDGWGAVGRDIPVPGEPRWDARDTPEPQPDPDTRAHGYIHGASNWDAGLRYLRDQLVDLSALRRDGAGLFAVFAYGGFRSTERADIAGVLDQTDNPLQSAAVFRRDGGPRAVAQWIMNNIAREAIFSQRGDRVRAAERRSALQRLEQASSRLVGEDVHFSVEFDPAEVRVAIGSSPPCPMSQLPDGLQSLLSWLGDLLMRLDRIPWKTAGPVTDRPFILLLDEVEVHMHPAWQRRVLPMVETLFPNAQIIASTHSPFVIGSATDAWIHPFRLESGKAVVGEPVPSVQGSSVAAILDRIMGVREEFDVDSEANLKEFRALLHRRLAGDDTVEADLAGIADGLANRSRELGDIVGAELRRMRRHLAASSQAAR